MAIASNDQGTEAKVALPTREKRLFWTSEIGPREYLAYLKEILPVNHESLKFLTDLLANNNQIDPRVLYRNFRLIENILLWNLHEGKATRWGEKERNQNTAATLLNSLTQTLESWDRQIFRADDHFYETEETSDQYKTAARFIVAQAAPFFTSIAFISSPDVKAQTIRTALSLITETAEYDNHITSLLNGRAMETGAKADAGEDEFYETLVALVASWTPAERKAITKQLGDMLSIDEKQNSTIHIPVTENMVSLASLILANIRLHNQNEADFTSAKENKKEVNLAARGPELGTEPVPALLKKLQGALTQGKFSESEKKLASQLFEVMLIEARLFNPAVILAIVETYGHTKLREALVKAYSRRDQNISLTEVDDVLMYMITGTLASKPNHQAHSLAEQGLGWLVEDLGKTQLVDMLAKLIRSTAKFGLHSYKGVNPVPQAMVFKTGEKIEQAQLDKYFKTLNASDEQRTASIVTRFDKPNHTLLSIEDKLITNRKTLTPETRESLKIRMRRWLDVETTLWETVITAAKNTNQSKIDAAIALWNMSFTACINVLDEPNSEFFQLDPQLVLDFSSTLAQRITARYDSFSQLRMSLDSGIPQKLKSSFLLSLNRAAAHWSPVVTKALFTQVEVIVAQNDSHYFSGLIPDIINAVAYEQVPTAEGQPAGVRAAHQKQIVELLANLLKAFPRNTTVVGADARMSLVTALSSIFGDLTRLAKEWNENKEYQWKQGIDTSSLRQKEREAAAVAQLLNLLAAHAGDGKEIGKASEGQKTLANVLNTAIAKEIAAVLQAEMPSSTLITNIVSSREKIETVEKTGESHVTEMRKKAAKQLDELKGLAKRKKLTLSAVKDLINSGLHPLTEAIEAESMLHLKQVVPGRKQEQPVNLYDVLATLAKQYLGGNHDPEIAPIGAVLAQALSQKFHNENLATTPIAELRAKIAEALGETLDEDLVTAVELDARKVGQEVLAASLARYFGAADLYKAVEQAKLTEEDIEQIRMYLMAVRKARNSVTSVNGPIERHLAQIRRNLINVLGAATHLIKMPEWEQISAFMELELDEVAELKTA